MRGRWTSGLVMREIILWDSVSRVSNLDRCVPWDFSLEEDGKSKLRRDAPF